jgi:hypothetical protein
MTKADELNALADRCEREEASRVLDRAIASALGYQVEVIEIPEGHPMADVFKAGSGLEFMFRPGCDREAIPPWTTSLDAAVTLVKFDALSWFTLQRTEEGDWHPELYFKGKGPDEAITVADGIKSPALALCAAALRARALSQTDGAEERK